MKFVKDTLLKYNSFASLNGYYSQVSGCSMGSRLSPLLSNIYMTMIEEKINHDHENGATRWRN